MNDLDEALLAAHAAGNTEDLVRLYGLAADTADDEEAAAFYLTHAYVFALELGHPDAKALHDKLVSMGRDAPLHPAAPPLR